MKLKLYRTQIIIIFAARRDVGYHHIPFIGLQKCILLSAQLLYLKKICSLTHCQDIVRHYLFVKARRV